MARGGTTISKTTRGIPKGTALLWVALACFMMGAVFVTDAEDVGTDVLLSSDQTEALANRLLSVSAEELAEHHHGALLLFDNAARQAQAENDWEMWLRYSRQSLAVMKAAVPRLTNDQLLQKKIEKASILAEMAIGTVLLRQRRPAEACVILQAAFNEVKIFTGHPAEMEIATFLGIARIESGAVAQGAKLLQSVAGRIPNESPAKMSALIWLQMALELLEEWTDAGIAAAQLRTLALHSKQPVVAAATIRSECPSENSDSSFSRKPSGKQRESGSWY